MNTTSLRSLAELTRYRGRYGQWSWALHRISGLGVLLFLVLHILDTSTVYFAPSAYDFFVALYKHPLFGIGEIIIGACLIFHALNGLRIVIMDFWPHLWEKQPQAQRLVWVLFAVLFVPTAGIMLFRIIRYALTQ